MTEARRRLVVIGAGGHGREILDIAFAAEGYQVMGVLDDAPDHALLEARGAVHLGRVEALDDYKGWSYLVAVGDPALRRRLADRAEAAGLEASKAVHPSATIGTANELAPGFVAFPQSSITTNVHTGRHVHVNVGASVAHDCRLGDFVTVNPGAVVSGNVVLEEDVTVGAGATVIQGITIGRGTTVGAGAVVVEDLPPGCVAVGVPARPRPPRS